MSRSTHVINGVKTSGTSMVTAAIGMITIPSHPQRGRKSMFRWRQVAWRVPYVHGVAA
jgi:hypothetical protein